MKSVWAFFLILIIASLAVAQTNPSAPSSLDDVLNEALQNSAELASLQEQSRASEAMEISAAGRPDAMASAGLVNIPVGSGLRLDKDPMSGLELMYSRELPRKATLQLNREVQQQETAMLRARWADRKNRLIREVKQAFFGMQYFDEAIAIAENNKLLAEDLVASSQTIYATGRGLQQDVFKAQVQLSKMLDMLIMLRQERAMAAIRLNRLLYRASPSPLASLGKLRLSPNPANTIGPDPRPLNNPQLAEMRARITQTQYQIRRTRQEFKPEYNYSLAYMIRQPVEEMGEAGDDMWSAKVGLSLPWFNRRPKAAELAAAEATQAAAEKDLAAMENELAGMVQEKLIELKRTEQQLSLVETALLPQSEGALASSRSAYATGKLELMSVLDNQMNFYNLQQQRLDLIFRHEQSLADLEYFWGQALPAAAPAGKGE